MNTAIALLLRRFSVITGGSRREILWRNKSESAMETTTLLKIGALKTRETPRQKRAQTRVMQILQAAADTVVDHPPHAVSTTMIADRARIPVSSIYRYFPKVEEVFDELYLQISGLFEARVLAIFEDPETYPGWRDRLRGIFEAFRTFRDEHPYYLPLLQFSISRSGPETVNLGENAGIQSVLSERWAKGGDGFSGGDPQIVAQVSMQIFLSIEGLLAAQSRTDEADRYIKELSLNLESYLANYLNDDR